MKTDTLSTQEKICTLEIAVKAISGKWKIPIIWQISQGLRRPSEFVRAIPNADRRVLNQHLKELERDGILHRIVFNELPPRVEYELTDMAKDLSGILWDLNDWGKHLLKRQEELKEK